MSKTRALAYYRTSSAANVGEDKDSLARQRAAVEAYAARAGVEIIGEEYDAAVSGADPLDARKGFTTLLQRIAGNGVRTILVETANRFARDLVVQETGWRRLREQGIELIAVDSPSAFLDDTPTAVFIRQVLGAAAQLDKAVTVAKLKAARERKKARTGKGEGRKGIAELQPAAVAAARSLRKAGRRRRTLREIAGLLAEASHLASSGKPYSPSVVRAMLEQKPLDG
jgi:DNA invertase Pin-like site-specific DNA recombinase